QPRDLYCHLDTKAAASPGAPAPAAPSPAGHGGVGPRVVPAVRHMRPGCHNDQRRARELQERLSAGGRRIGLQRAATVVAVDLSFLLTAGIGFEERARDVRAGTPVEDTSVFQRKEGGLRRDLPPLLGR